WAAPRERPPSVSQLGEKQARRARAWRERRASPIAGRAPCVAWGRRASLGASCVAGGAVLWGWVAEGRAGAPRGSGRRGSPSLERNRHGERERERGEKRAEQEG